MPEPQVITRNIQTYTIVAAIANSVAFIVGTVLVIGAGISTFGCGCLLIVLPLVQFRVGDRRFRCIQPAEPASVATNLCVREDFGGSRSGGLLRATFRSSWGFSNCSSSATKVFARTSVSRGIVPTTVADLD